MLLECPALADLRDEYSPLVAECSGVMARLVWASDQPMVSRYIIACLGFAHIRRQFRSLYQDADGTMQCFVWHKDQKAVCHCPAANLNLADDSNKDASS